MKKLIFLLLIFFFVQSSFANHITGGTVYYTLKSQSGNSFTYHVTLNLYRDCNTPNGAPLDAAAPIGIFDNATNTMVWTNTIQLGKKETLNLGSPSPCISNPPIVCYELGYYEFDVTLPGIPQ